MTHYGRSPQEIRDDFLSGAHSFIHGCLNAVCAGRCLYTGKRRVALEATLAEIEELMFNDKEIPNRIAYGYWGHFD